MPMPESTDEPVLDVQFPRRPERVAYARDATRQTLATWGTPAETAEAVVLVVSELVTNAVRHASSAPGREIALRLSRTPDRLIRVEVSDASNTLPRPRPATPDDESHRGLPLVAALATRHGVTRRRHGAGKTVWAELAPSAAESGGDVHRVWELGQLVLPDTRAGG